MTDLADRARSWASRARTHPLLPFDIASIAYFRIALGAAYVWEEWRDFENDWVAC